VATTRPETERFGDVALRHRFVTKEQLDAALERQRTLGIPIGEVLVEMGFVTPSQVAAILKFQRVVYAEKDKEARGEVSSTDPLLGEALGGCLLLEPLGSGAMGRTYKAHHLKLDRDVCVKVLHPELCRDRRTLARFTREARAAARLEHPAIVSVYDFDEMGLFTYLVMQLVDGKSLKEVLDTRGALGPKRATFVGARLAEALACAHQEKIVHRDVKPANVLISKTGQIKLTDFGLVRVIDQGSEGGDRSAFGELIGTPAYMSPEQASAAPEIDGRSDIYSLGILIHELVTGKLPFEAKDLIGLLKKQMTEPFPRMRDRRRDCPQALDDLVRRFCAKDAALRPDAQTAAKELRAIYRTFGAEGPLDVTGPPTAALKPSLLQKALEEAPTPTFTRRDIQDVAVEKLIARALAGELHQSLKDAKRLAPAAAREAAARILSGLAAANRYDEAYAAKDSLGELVRDNATGLAILGKAHVLSGATADGERLLVAAHEKKPDDFEVALELAQVRGSLGKKAEASLVLEAALGRGAPASSAFKRAAELRYIVLGDLEGAAAWYGKAAELDRSAFEPRQQEGFLLLELGKAREAAKALEDAVARSPSSPFAHELLGKARLAKGDAAGAASALRRALELDPGAIGARLLLIEEARRARRWDEVRRLARDGLVRTNDQEDLLLAMALVQEETGDLAGATRALGKLLEKKPGHPGATEALERVRKKLA
jgi:Tfp pilus assembly protein PilF